MVKGIKMVIISVLLASILMPFSVFANTVGGDSPIIGVNISILDYEFDVEPLSYNVLLSTDQTRWQCMSSHSTMGCQVWQSQSTSDVVQHTISGAIGVNNSTTYGRVYQYDFVFDKSYVGSVTFSQGLTGTYYVNGDHLILNSETLVGTFSVSSYSLTYAPEETITRLRQFNFPIESFSFVYQLFVNGFECEDIMSYYYANYPIFKIPKTSVIESRFMLTSQYYRYIFGTNAQINDLAGFNSYFELSNGTFTNFNILMVANDFRFYSVDVNVASSGTFQFKTKNSSVLMIPVLSIRSDYLDLKHFSTDFALVWGLSNNLMDDIHLIAQGSQQSNSAASDLESANTSMASDMNSMATIENGYSQDFNSQLQNIDFTNPIQQNQGILPAANFVISIFNGLISNNPFTVLIIIVCILLIGKKVIGK